MSECQMQVSLLTKRTIPGAAIDHLAPADETSYIFESPSNHANRPVIDSFRIYMADANPINLAPATPTADQHLNSTITFLNRYLLEQVRQ
jgi:hypothetical protein